MMQNPASPSSTDLLTIRTAGTVDQGLGTPGWLAPVSRFLLGLFAGLSAALAVILAGRRITGALTAPSPTTLIFMFTAGCLACLAWRIGAQRILAAGRPRRVADTTAAISLAALLVATAFPQHALALLSNVAVAAGTVTTWCLLLRRFSPPDRSELAIARTESEQPRAEEATALSPAVNPPAQNSGVEAEAAEHRLPAGVDMELHHGNSTDTDGPFVSGLFRCRFEPNQRVLILHVPFTPAFQETPNVEWDLLGDGIQSIVATSVQTFGARLELKRELPCDAELEIQLQLYAC